MATPFVPGLTKSPVGLSKSTKGFINAAKGRGYVPGGITNEVRIVGLDVLYMDAYAVSAFWGEVMWPLLDTAGQIIQHNAQDIVQVDTQDTRRSIHYKIFTTPQGMGVEVGPTTSYAPDLEYGTYRTRPYPFMLPAIDMMEAAFMKTVDEIAAVASNNRRINHTEYGGLNSVLSKYRSFLYSSSRALGNVAAITNVPVLAGLRANMQSQAQQLGNIQAVMHGHVIKRYERVLVGRGLGRLQTGVTGGGSFTATLGPQASRAYNIFIGRVGRSFLP